ncbi:hypothetical protein [Maridesulfovibrio sp.]|uniref:hypothetical protein n=1 Tax=Maridesulfovibrio sp. TaxID=2795000 RepID=UPI002A187904|nr:hypothetical protein [Maridesulfovibrio sp.]
MCSDLDVGKNYFHLFSLVEYALKANGYCKLNGDIVIGVDWFNFINDNPNIFEFASINDGIISASIQFLLDAPPKVQQMTTANGNTFLRYVDMDLPTTTSNSHKISRYIRQVRNNLFHGGKYRGEVFLDPARSHDLIMHCTVLLQYLVEYDNDVAEAFRGCFSA